MRQGGIKVRNYGTWCRPDIFVFLGPFVTRYKFPNGGIFSNGSRWRSGWHRYEDFYA